MGLVPDRDAAEEVHLTMGFDCRFENDTTIALIIASRFNGQFSIVIRVE